MADKEPKEYIILESNGEAGLADLVNEHIDGIEYTDPDTEIEEIFRYFPVGGPFTLAAGQLVCQAMLKKSSRWQQPQ